MNFFNRISRKWARLQRERKFRNGEEQSLYRWKDSGKLVLMYHNVVKNYDFPINIRQISVDDFSKQLRYLQKRYSIVRLPELFESKSNKAQVAITFDDGLVNNLNFALPVLEELKIPATIFITTIHLENQNILWPDALDLVLYQNRATIEIDGKIFKRESDNLHRSNGIRIPHWIKSRTLEEKWKIIEKLALPGNKLWDDSTLQNYWRIMDENEIRKISQSPFIDIGSHCITHNNLAQLSSEEVKRELYDSKSFLEGITGRKITSIAFPDGSYTRQTLDTAEAAGYKYMLAEKYLFDEDRNDPRILDRFGFYSLDNWVEQLHKANLIFHNSDIQKRTM